MDKIKQLGQVMTPENIVNHMIDDVLRMCQNAMRYYQADTPIYKKAQAIKKTLDTRYNTNKAKTLSMPDDY